MIKMQMGDTSPKGKRRIANAKGHNVKSIADTISEPLKKYTDSLTVDMPITRQAQWAGGGANVAIGQPMFFSPMHTPQNWQIAQKRKECYMWARFYYENEPKVAAGVDFYSQFPMNGFELECKNKSVRIYFESLVKDLKLAYWLKLISHDYFLLGDVFPFLTIFCKKCGGTGILRSGQQCNHPDGKFNSITILNPDFIEVEDSPIPGPKAMFMIPDENLKRLVQRREPAKDYERLPKQFIKSVGEGTPILLSPRSISHLKHSEVGYGRYGSSLLRRLFTILAYKTKLMTANWIIAERLVLPVRIVKIGDKDRPAGPEDISDMQMQLTAVSNDPNLTIVTHHAFEYDWIGAQGKIHNIQGEWEQIGKEILDGLMLNQALLNGEMGGFANAQIGVETMIRRLDNWRNTLSEWVEEHIFKPTAMMQGFIDEEASEQLGKIVYLYPTIKWNDLQLRDKTNKLQLLMQLHDKQIISTEKLCEEFDIDYDQEIERIRSEQMMMGPAGAIQPGGGGGLPGAMGAMGGGAPPPSNEMGVMPPGGPGAPGMGGPEGTPGSAGGAPGGAGGAGGAPGGGGMSAGANAAGKVFKRGKAPKGKNEEQHIAPPTFVKLTKIEQRLWKALQDMNLPFPIYGQYKQSVPGQQQPYSMDFAIPSIGVDFESDGAIWHEQEGAKARDAERDRKLAAYGWRIIRFNEDAINEHMDEVVKVMQSNITEAAHEHFHKGKKASTEEGINKYASLIYPSVRVVYLKNGSVLDWDGNNPSGIVQVIFGDVDYGTIQSDQSGGSPKDQGPWDKLEGNIQGQIQIIEKEI